MNALSVRTLSGFRPERVRNCVRSSSELASDPRPVLSVRHYYVINGRFPAVRSFAPDARNALRPDGLALRALQTSALRAPCDPGRAA
jgi:hypothetical protein